MIIRLNYNNILKYRKKVNSQININAIEETWPFSFIDGN